VALRLATILLREANFSRYCTIRPNSAMDWAEAQKEPNRLGMGTELERAGMARVVGKVLEFPLTSGKPLN